MNPSTVKMEFVDSRKCVPDPKVNAFPSLAPDQFERLRDSITDERAILEPLKGRKEGDSILIYDGRSRLKIAQELGFRVQVVIDSNADPIAVALTSTIARRQLTTSGIVLTLYIAHPELHENSIDRKVQNLRQGNTVSKDVRTVGTFKALADRYKVPAEYFSKLVAIHQSFKGNEDEWGQTKHLILAGELSIVQAYVGACSRVQTKGSKRTPPNYRKLLWRTAITEFPSRLSVFLEKSTEAERLEFWQTFKTKGCENLGPKNAQTMADLLLAYLDEKAARENAESSDRDCKPTKAQTRNGASKK